MANNLIERYVYAVTKRMPEHIQKDVTEELRALIEDMLIERCGENTPTEKDIYDVLTALGTPGALYEKYDTESKKCLIGAPYYTIYKQVLKIVMICVCFATTLAFVIDHAVSAQVIWYKSLLQWAGTLWSGAVGAFTFVTILFAFFYHKNIHLEYQESLHDLPPIPKNNQSISTSESIFSMSFSIIFAVLFLVAPQTFFVLTADRQMIPIFNISFIQTNWLIFVILMAAGIIPEAVKLVEKCYNNKVMIISIIANGISAVLCFWLLGDNRIINADFTGSISSLLAEKNDFLIALPSNFRWVLLAIILLLLVYDTIEAIVKSK